MTGSCGLTMASQASEGLDHPMEVQMRVPLEQKMGVCGKGEFAHLTRP